MNENKTAAKRHIDPWTTYIPFAIILLLCVLFVLRPEQSTNALSRSRSRHPACEPLDRFL